MMQILHDRLHQIASVYIEIINHHPDAWKTDPLRPCWDQLKRVMQDEVWHTLSDTLFVPVEEDAEKDNTIHIRPGFINYPFINFSFKYRGIAGIIAASNFLEFDVKRPFDNFIWPISLWPDYVVALLSAYHARLGQESWISQIDVDIMRTILNSIWNDGKMFESLKRRHLLHQW